MIDVQARQVYGNAGSNDYDCVVTKANSDGSGGNKTPAVCTNFGVGSTIYSWCPGSSELCRGYATIINNGSHGGSFYGYLEATA